MTTYNNWEQVPSTWKNTKKVSKLNFTNSPFDKNLISLLEPFAGDDYLRPIMTGINFDDKGIAVTDAHKLVFLPYPNSKYSGTYATTKKAEKAQKKTFNSNEVKNDLFDGKYPNYWAVIPRFDLQNIHFFSKISAYKLLQYCQVAKKVNNLETVFAYKTEFHEDLLKLVLNPTFLETIMKFFLQQGIEEIFVSTTGANKAIVFSNELEYSEKSIIALVMPKLINIGKETQIDFGSLNIDDNIELKCYYNFSTNEIYNANGSIADYQMTYETNTKLSINELNILKKLTAKTSLQSLNNILVDDGIIFASNFDQSVYLKTTTEAPGIYTYKSDALVKSADSIDTLKKDKLYFEENYLKEFKPTIELKIDTQAFIYYFNILKDFVGDDDLRPLMTGVLLEIDNENNIYLVATNAFVLARFNVSEYCSVIHKDKTNSDIILSLNLLVDFLKISDTYTVFKTNNKISIWENENSKFVSKNIEGIYPKYRNILPTEFTKKIVLNAKEIIECFKNNEVKNFIKENKQKNKNGIFQLIATENNLQAIHLKFLEASNNELETSAEIELCHTKIHLEDFTENKNIDSLLLIMPIMSKEEKLLFAFNVSLFEQLISNYNNDKAIMYSVAPNKAFLIDAAPLDFNQTVNYKKGLKVEQEHKQTLEQIAEGKITVKQAIEKTVEDHLKEDPDYYTKLEKIENKSNESINKNQIVLNEGYGIVINDIFNKWTKIDNTQSHKKWVDLVKKTKFGTYGSISFMEVLKNFNPIFPNDVLKNDFYNELQAALNIPKQNRINIIQKTIDHSKKENIIENPIYDWDTNFTDKKTYKPTGVKLSDMELESIDVYNDNFYNLNFTDGGTFNASTKETIGMLSIAKENVKIAVIFDNNETYDSKKNDQSIKRKLKNLADKSGKIIVKNNSTNREDRVFPILFVDKNVAGNYEIINEYATKLETPRKVAIKQITKNSQKYLLNEAIEALELTLEFTEKISDQKEIQEAIEALKITLEFV